MYFKPSAWNVCLHEMKFIHEYNKRPGIFLEVNKTWKKYILKREREGEIETESPCGLYMPFSRKVSSAKFEFAIQIWYQSSHSGK